MALCLVAIFKNESHILEEYINHYIKQGVDHFFFIDNGSTDEYSILNKFENVTLVVDNLRHMQSHHYNRYINECKNYEWVLICDLDEFVYARRQFKTIPEYLNTLDDNISQVFIPWKIFGSNGFNTPDKVQPSSVVDSFTKRINYDKESNFQGVIMEGNDKYSFSKCIVRTKHLQHFGIHSHSTINNYIGADNNNFIHPNNQFYKIDETILSKSFLHLNHYAIQSYEWFMRIKATRGAADSINNENVRDETYFKEFDNVSNDIEDAELKLL
jgi:hypothetical protein